MKKMARLLVILALVASLNGCGGGGGTSGMGGASTNPGGPNGASARCVDDTYSKPVAQLAADRISHNMWQIGDQRSPRCGGILAAVLITQ